MKSMTQFNLRLSCARNLFFWVNGHRQDFYCSLSWNWYILCHTCVYGLQKEYLAITSKCWKYFLFALSWFLGHSADSVVVVGFDSLYCFKDESLRAKCGGPQETLAVQQRHAITKSLREKMFYGPRTLQPQTDMRASIPPPSFKETTLPIKGKKDSTADGYMDDPCRSQSE